MKRITDLVAANRAKKFWYHCYSNKEVRSGLKGYSEKSIRIVLAMMRHLDRIA